MLNVRNSNKILAQAAIILFIFWVIALILLTRPLINTSSNEISNDVIQRLSRAVTELESLKQRNRELQWILTNFSLETNSGSVKEDVKDVVEKLRLTLEENLGSPINFGGFQKSPSSSGPKKEYEVKRRAIYKGVKEMWYYLRHELEGMKKSGSNQNPAELSDRISEVLLSGSEHER